MEAYRRELTPLLEAMSPAGRFIVKAMMDEESGYSINLDPDDYRRAMEFFRTALDLAGARGRRSRAPCAAMSETADRSGRLAW